MSRLRISRPPWPSSRCFIPLPRSITTKRARNERFNDELGGIDDFPFPSTALSLWAVHPMLTALAERLLRTRDLHVYSIEAWAKYTGAADYDQHLHRDYLGASLVVPSTDVRYGQVEMFVYLNDVPAELGPPAFVPLRHTADMPMIPNWSARGRSPRSRPADVAVPTRAARPLRPRSPAVGAAGTVVAYTNRTFHRATQLATARGARYTLHVNFRPAGERMAESTLLAPPRQQNPPGKQLRRTRFAPPARGCSAGRRQAARSGPLTPVAGTRQRYPGIDLSAWEGAPSDSGDAIGREDRSVEPAD